MKKISTILVLLLTISMISAIPMITKTASALPIPFDNKIVWNSASGSFPSGDVVAASLMWNPEYIKLTTEGPSSTTGVACDTDTTIILQGLDAYLQPIEASVFIPAGTGDSITFVFLDDQSRQPVAFSKITNIIQQGGTHSNSFQISTEPAQTDKYGNLYEDYLGRALCTTDGSSGFIPGRADPSWTTGPYLKGDGNGGVIVQSFPVEPANPDPLKVVLNWKDNNRDLLPDSSELSKPIAPGPVYLYFEGLDEAGNKLYGRAVIGGTNTVFPVDTVDAPTPTGVHVDHTWSVLCKTWGGSGKDQYYIFTEPNPEQPLFEYYIRINHVTLTPQAYDIIANPNPYVFDGVTASALGLDPSVTFYPGKTEVIVALRDLDGNLVYMGDADISSKDYITVNFQTTGGTIAPALTWIYKGQCCAEVGLTADTNARTIRVNVDVNIPAHTPQSPAPYAPEMNLQAYTELTFDGINSVGPVRNEGGPVFGSPTDGLWPIKTLMCGFDTYSDIDCEWHDFPVPGPDTVLPPICGGPEPWGVKLDGPVYEVSIPLYVGCNLISSPVYPMLGCLQYLISTYGPGIPMDLLFGMTAAPECIEAIWYFGSGWNLYVPGVSPAAVPTSPNIDTLDMGFFKDGYGYWIKAEKPCTLEISGVAMENAPFIPAEYPVHHSWNLMGVTSVAGIATDQYLESLATGTSSSGSVASAVGPIWVYYAWAKMWVRDPTTLYPGEAFWMNYKLGSGDLAP